MYAQYLERPKNGLNYKVHEGRDDVQEDALMSSVRHCYALGAYSNRLTLGVDKQLLLKRK